MKKLLPILVLFSLFLQSSCLKEGDPSYGTASTSYAATIMPLQYAYFVGDTISIRGDVNAVLDFNNRETLEKANTFVSYAIQIVEMQPNNAPSIPALNSFDLIGLESSILQPIDSSLLNIGSTCGNWRCNYGVGVIPQKPGIFAVVLSKTVVEADELGTTYLEGDYTNNSTNFGVCMEINTDDIGVIPGWGSNTDYYFFKVE